MPNIPIAMHFPVFGKILKNKQTNKQTPHPTNRQTNKYIHNTWNKAGLILRQLSMLNIIIDPKYSLVVSSLVPKNHESRFWRLTPFAETQMTSSKWKTTQNLHWRFILRVRAFFHKTVRVCHVYCNFKIGFTCRITVIFGTLKDGSLLINTLASNICFSYRNMFQNGVNALSKIVDAFLSKSSKFHLVRIIR